MITSDMKVSKLLDEYPDSLQILIKISSHFQKLENKLLRKALAGRVTIEQAATIAGVELKCILSELNRNYGKATDNKVQNEEILSRGEENYQDKENLKYLTSINPEKIKEFDVRPILDSGKDPLKWMFMIFQLVSL